MLEEINQLVQLNLFHVLVQVAEHCLLFVPLLYLRLKSTSIKSTVIFTRTPIDTGWALLESLPKSLGVMSADKSML